MKAEGVDKSAQLHLVGARHSVLLIVRPKACADYRPAVFFINIAALSFALVFLKVYADDGADIRAC
ncbi:hypothetical protein RHECNPAF_12210081 [Rhizobium etli CNPAF512]|nr:hypothetical protein RHECNPAF_12210081 [Rhizobium etli CNPAF512]